MPAPPPPVAREVAEIAADPDRAAAYARLLHLQRGCADDPSAAADLAAESPSTLLPLLLRDAADPDEAVAASALKCLGFALYHPVLVSTISVQVAQLVLDTLVHLIMNTQMKSACNLGVWCISVQQFEPWIIEDRVAPVLTSIVHALDNPFGSLSTTFEGAQAIMKIAGQSPKRMKDLSSLWVPPICRRLLSSDKQERDMAERCLTKVKGIILPPEPLLSKLMQKYASRPNYLDATILTQCAERAVASDLEQKLLSCMMNMLDDPSKKIHAVKSWGCIVSLLGSSAVNNRPLLNKLLKVPERMFIDLDPQVQIATMVSWRNLVDAFFPSQATEKETVCFPFERREHARAQLKRIRQGENLSAPVNQNLLAQCCMHLKALLAVQHIKWLPWDISCFHFQLEILGIILNPELFQNMIPELMVIVMDSLTQILRFLLQGVQIELKEERACERASLCITDVCKFVKKLFLDHVGRHNNGNKSSVLLQFGLQFMKVVVEELDHSLLASKKIEISLEIEHIKEKQYAECSPKVSYPGIKPLSYMEMVSPAVYMTALSLSMVVQFIEELSHGDAEKLILIISLLDSLENLDAVVSFMYLQIRCPIFSSLRKKWLMLWNKFAKHLNEQVIDYLNINPRSSSHDVIYQFFCYPFFALLYPEGTSFLWNDDNSSESYAPVTPDIEVELAAEVYRSLCTDSSSDSNASSKVFLEGLCEYLVCIIDENMPLFQANLEHCSEKFKNSAILSALGEVVVGLLQNDGILKYANEEMNVTNEGSGGCRQPNLSLSCLKLVNRFMRLSSFVFKANTAGQHEITSRVFSSLSTFVGHLKLKKDILLLFEGKYSRGGPCCYQLTEWLSLSAKLFCEMQLGETIDRLEKLWLKTMECLKRSQLVSDAPFLHQTLQVALNHPHHPISAATASVWRAASCDDTNRRHSACLVSQLDQLLMDRRKDLSGSSDAANAITREEIDISRRFALKNLERRTIASNPIEHAERDDGSLKISVSLGRKRLNIMKYSTKPKKLQKNTVHNEGLCSRIDSSVFSPCLMESKVCRKPELILEMLKRK
ncbi:hypothetical protein ACP70R_041768 [Stipagrostis hirtigluma subsp. patula]